MHSPKALLTNDTDWQYQTFDVVAAASLLFAPAIMWIADMVHVGSWLSPRPAVSHYHDMVPPGAYFIPLTAAVMLFFVNGWLYRENRIHVAMGGLLLGVILFDHEDLTEWPHYWFAVCFFFLGACVGAIREQGMPQWTPIRWVASALVLPIWLVFNQWSLISKMRTRIVAVMGPFALLGILGWLVGGWLGSHWLFVAEWVASAAVVFYYLNDMRDHAHRTPADAQQGQ